MGEMIEIAALDGEGQFAAYRALPPGQPPKAAIIVVQEIFGINPGIRRKADDWAALGYLALAPDMFWRFAPGFVADPDVAAEREQALKIYQQFDFDHGVADVETCIRAARAMLGQGKVGVVGFCLGGSVGYLAATRTDADASAAYYGGQIASALHEAHAIARPLLLHFGEADAHIDAAARTAVHAALDGNRHVKVHEYSGADHGFADTFGQRRQVEAATLADARTQAFFREHLG